MRLVKVVQHPGPLSQHVEFGHFHGVVAAKALCGL